jgi:hypothetical protein
MLARSCLLASLGMSLGVNWYPLCAELPDLLLSTCETLCYCDDWTEWTTVAWQ